MLYSSVLCTSLHVCEVSPEHGFLTAYGILVEVAWDESCTVWMFSVEIWQACNNTRTYRVWAMACTCSVRLIWSERVQVGLRFSCYQYFFSVSLLIFQGEFTNFHAADKVCSDSIKMRTNTGGWQHCTLAFFNLRLLFVLPLVLYQSGTSLDQVRLGPGFRLLI